MWELDHKESWALKNWCFWTVMLEKILETPLDSKEIKPVNPKGNQSWVFIGRTDVEAEAPILGPPDTKNWLIWKDPDSGKDWRQEEKGTTEDEMVGWHHRLNEFEQALGVGNGQGSLACCSPWGCKESDMTELLNWTESNNSGNLKGTSLVVYWLRLQLSMQRSLRDLLFPFFFLWVGIREISHAIDIWRIRMWVLGSISLGFWEVIFCSLLP